VPAQQPRDSSANPPLEAYAFPKDVRLLVVLVRLGGLPYRPHFREWGAAPHLYGSLRAFYGFTGVCDLPAASPDGNQKRLEPLSKILARKPRGIHQQEIVHGTQFNLEALEQFLRGVVQV